MLVQRLELFCYAFLPNYLKIIIRLIALLLNPAPPNRIISDVIPEYRQTERHYSIVPVEQAAPSGFGDGQLGYVSICLVCG